MPEISPEDAVGKFSQLIKPFLSSDINPRLLIETVANFYRDFRIAAAEIEADSDMLLLEWGTKKPNLTSDFTDFRDLSGEKIEFDTRKFQWLGLTRQIFAAEDKETEFDDEAIALSVSLFFKEVSGGEPSSNLWIANPNESGFKLEEFLRNPYVENLVDSKPSLVNAFVTFVG